MMTVKILPNDKATPPGKLADVELHFASSGRPFDPAFPPADEVLGGLKLIGFAIWERRTGGGRNVTFPARQYTLNGDRRSFALLRPISDTTAQDGVRSAILAAYETFEAETAVR